MESYLMTIAFNGALSLSLSFGHELGLFDALAAIGSKENPATATQLAERAEIDLQFATMWLNGMVDGKIIESNEFGDKFWITNENLDVLTGDIPAAGLVYTRLVSMISSRYNEAIKMAKEKDDKKKSGENQNEHTHGHSHGHNETQGHGHGHNHGHGHGHEHNHDNHGDAFPLMELLSKTMYKKLLIPNFLPLFGVREKLENDGGIEVLDVGCGTGFHVCEFAREFPNSNFTGIDISQSAIKRAKEVAQEMNLKNVKFEVISGEEMPEAWSGKYDWVFSWNAIHDHKHPKIAIKEINRVLNESGRYTMIEINKPENLNEHGITPLSKFWNVASVFKISTAHRLSPDAFKWTNTAANEMLKEAGFKTIEPIKLPFFDFNILFIAQKHLEAGKNDL